MKESTKSVTLAVPEKVLSELDQHAEAELTNRSSVIRKAIVDYLRGKGVTI